MNVKSGFILFATAFIIGSCDSNKGSKEHFASPEGYNLNKPVIVKLPAELDEISGIDYYLKDSSIFAISDDRGAIFKIKPGPVVTKWKFSHGSDFEDLVRIGELFYILQSNGDIYKVTYREETPHTDVYKFDLSNNNEFETIYADSATNRLVLICKDCESDDKKSTTTYSFDPATNTFSDSSFSIDTKKAALLANQDKIRFKPSAAAINPVNKLLYIISSVNKMILVSDLKGNIMSAYKLNPKFFKQPEGIAFKPNGDMIISNESAEIGAATLLIFKRGVPDNNK